jgi:hypothetical protein
MAAYGTMLTQEYHATLAFHIHCKPVLLVNDDSLAIGWAVASKRQLIRAGLFIVLIIINLRYLTQLQR